MSIPFHNIEFLHEAYARLPEAPKQNGTVDMIVIRPATNERKELQTVNVSAKRGLYGDAWEKHCGKKLVNGDSNPDLQIAVAYSKLYNLITGGRENWAIAGDNLFLDFDLSHNNMQAGDRLKIGTSILEMTPYPHNGCAKFKDRFGIDALKFVSHKNYHNHKLRGIYLKVIQDGVISIGDKVIKAFA